MATMRIVKANAAEYYSHMLRSHKPREGDAFGDAESPRLKMPLPAKMLTFLRPSLKGRVTQMRIYFASGLQVVDDN
jgi:hypothetical protein